MESTKLKTQQNAFLASRGHKQNPATIQDLKWPGKYKGRSCCCCRRTSVPQYLCLFSPAPCPGVQGEEEKVLLFEHGIHIALFQGKAAWRTRLLSFLLSAFGVFAAASIRLYIWVRQRAQDTWKELSLAHLCLVNVVGNMLKDLLRHQTPEETLNLSWAPLNHLCQAHHSKAQLHPPSRKLECHD